MKILLIDVYNYNKGGAETVCFNTGKLLEKQGHEVIYFTLKWKNNLKSKQDEYFPESKETRKGMFRNAVNLLFYFYNIEAARQLKRLVEAEKPDIAHIHLMWGQHSCSILPVLKENHIPIVYTVHDYRLVCPAYTFKNGNNMVCEKCKGKHFYKCITNKCTKGSRFLSFVMAAEMYFRNTFFNPVNYFNGLIYVSDFAKMIDEKYMPRLKTIPSIRLYNFTLKKPDSQLPQGKYLLFFGRLSYEKGINTLLNAIKGTDVELKIVGTGPLEKELKDMSVADRLNVNFLGYKSGTELDNLIQQALFVVVPSEWYENNPMTIVESYTLGTPVIGANIGGIPEIIQVGRTGFLFESNNISSLRDTIMNACQITGNDYKSLRSNCLEYANSNFNKDTYLEKLLSFYKQIKNSVL